jgi:hypothetical protein
MRRVQGVILVAVTVLAAPVFAQNAEYVVLEVPGSDQTTPFGVNNSGDAVGLASSCADSSQWGFLLQKGEYSQLAVPGAVSTWPRAISERGEVVGYFYNAQFRAAAFRYWHGQYEVLDVPGLDVFALGVNNAGDIVGSINRNPGTDAFLLTNEGELTILQPPVEANLSLLNAVAVTNSGTVLGHANSTPFGASFTYRDGAFDVTPSFTALGGNERGDVLGHSPGTPISVYRNGQPLALLLPEGSGPLGISNTFVVGILPTTNVGGCLRHQGFKMRLP